MHRPTRRPTASPTAARSAVLLAARSASRSAPLAAALTAALLLSGCASTGGLPESDPADASQVEVMTWWVSGPEYIGFSAVVDRFRSEHPDLKVLNSSVKGAGREDALAALAARLEAGNPPDAYLAPGGEALASFAGAVPLEDLSGFVDEHGLTGAVRPELLELAAVDGTPSAVPVAVQRVNVLWSSVELLTAAGLDPADAPATIDDLLADLQAVRASGIEYPLALGGGTAEVEFFESLLLAEAGADGYRALLGEASWDTPAVRRAADQYLRLLDYAQPGFDRLAPSSAIRRVVDRKAAYAVGSDAAVQVFDSADRVYGADYTAIPVPGTAGVYDAVVEVFALPAERSHADAPLAWLETIASADAQGDLAAARSGIPVRSDAPAAGSGTYQQGAAASLAGDELVPSIAHGIALPPARTAGILDAVARFGADGRIEALITRLGGAQ
ncbi:MAG: ABC transporter substrate-binding protein [Schumannella sp.]